MGTSLLEFMTNNDPMDIILYWFDALWPIIILVIVVLISSKLSRIIELLEEMRKNNK